MSTTTPTVSQTPSPATPPYRFLERDPYSTCKQLSIRGRRIKASTIYGDFIREDEPFTPEQIAEDRELPLEAVLEAIVYCQSNPPEIEEDLRRRKALDQALGRDDPALRRRPTRILTAQELARIYNE